MTYTSAAVSIRNKLRGASVGGISRLAVELNRLRSEIPIGLYGELANATVRVAGAKSKLLLPTRRASYTEVFSMRLTSPLGLIQELAWTCTLLEREISSLKTFRELKQQFEQQLLVSNYARALDLLSKIKAISGVSIWLVEQTFATLQFARGLKEQKEFLERIHTEAPDSLIRVIAGFISERNEEQVSLHGFRNRLDEALTSWRLPGWLETYFRYRVVVEVSTSERELAAILAVDRESSAIDLYETFVTVCSSVVAFRGSSSTILNAVKKYVTRLALVGDYRLQSMAFVLGGSHQVTEAATSLCLESGCGPNTLGWRDDKGRVCTASASDDLPTIIDAGWIERTAREGNEPATTATSEGPLPIFHQMITDLRTVANRESARSDAWRRLYKQSLNLRGLDVAVPLLAQLFRRSTLFESDLAFPSASLLASRNLSPQAVLGLPASLRKSVLERVAACASPVGPVCSYEMLLRIQTGQCTEVDLDCPMCALESALRSLERNDFALAETAVRKLLTHTAAFWRAEGIRLQIRLATLQGQLDVAISLVAQACIDNEELSAELPLSDLFRGKKWASLQDIEPVRLGICLHWYINDSRDDDARFHLQMCVRSVHANGGRDKLTAAITCDAELDHFDRYFFAHVWVQNNLELVTEFQSSKAVDMERMAVCQALLSIDPANADLYEDEIKEITFGFALEEGMFQIDQSRIYVGFDGILRWAKNELKEAFNRWAELSKIDATEIPDARAIFAKVLENSARLPEELLVVPRSEADHLLVQMISKILHRLLHDPHDGLDSYLSLRVRHGSLMGFLRGPFDTEHLLVGRDDLSGRYRSNTYWLTEFANLPPAAQESLDDAFATFSAAFEHVTNHFIKNEVQIRSEVKPQGLIDLPVTPLLFNTIKIDLAGKQDFEFFVDMCFQHFLVQLKGPLGLLRARLSDGLLPELECAAQVMRDKARMALAYEESSSLNDAISRSLTAFRTVVSRVADWFKVTSTTDLSRTFSLEEAVEVAIETTCNVRRGFHPSITRELDPSCPRIAAQSLASITDVLFIMLDNVYKHNQEPNSRVVHLLVRLTDPRTITIRVENDLGQRVDAASEAKVSRIRNLIESEQHSALLAAEGGSGFIKLSKFSKNVDLALHPRPLDFGFSAGKSFFVELQLPFSTVTIEGDPSEDTVG